LRREQLGIQFSRFLASVKPHELELLTNNSRDYEGFLVR